MRTQILVVVAFLMIEPPPARARPTQAAPPTRLAIGHARNGVVRRTHVAILEADDGPHLRWTLDIATSARAPTDVFVPLRVSRDVSIRGFDLAIVGQPALRAVTATRWGARESYEILTGRNDTEDPGLLQIVATDGETDTLQLRVFPIARDAPGTVVIDMAIPGGNRLVVDPGSVATALEIDDGEVHATWKRGATPRSWPVRSARIEVYDAPPVLTRTVSLVAAPWVIDEVTTPRLEVRDQRVPSVELSARVQSPLAERPRALEAFR